MSNVREFQITAPYYDGAIWGYSYGTHLFCTNSEIDNH